MKIPWPFGRAGSSPARGTRGMLMKSVEPYNRTMHSIVVEILITYFEWVTRESSPFFFMLKNS